MPRNCEAPRLRGPLLSSLRRHLPGRLLGRYVIVGFWNTAFGYGMFVALTWLLEGRFPASYLAASLLASVFSVTMSFLTYKLLVFKTRGDYLGEWLRCVGVYSSGIVMSLVLLPVLVALLRLLITDPRPAPYVAGALLTGMQVVLSFVGHKRFTFRAP